MMTYSVTKVVARAKRNNRPACTGSVVNSRRDGIKHQQTRLLTSDRRKTWISGRRALVSTISHNVRVVLHSIDRCYCRFDFLCTSFGTPGQTVAGLVRVQKPVRILTRPATRESFVRHSPSIVCQSRVVHYDRSRCQAFCSEKFSERSGIQFQEIA